MAMEKIDNRYEIIRVLGSGLSGEVLGVRDEDGEKALKTLKRVQMNVSREEALQNFKNEFSILSELNHPNIARIFDYGYDQRIQKYYFTTELIEGSDFYQATEKASFDEIEDLVVQILRALNYLHSRHIYHLDIKPQNILVTERDGKKIAKLIDFGLAGFSSPRKKVGTPAYMAPEVIMGGQMDGRTDLYSFGVLLYKTLTRDNPFASKDVNETLNRQRSLMPKAPSEVREGVPLFWDRILARILEKLPSDRYPQASSVIRDINFLANRNYEVETIDTRLSYLPEKGNLVGRRKQMEIYKGLFDMTFTSSEEQSLLVVIEGRKGCGKTRFLSECKYHSQLRDIPVFSWKSFKDMGDKVPAAPWCLTIDEGDVVGADQVNRILQEQANARVIILWALERAPTGWSHCEIISLKNFTQDELTDYVVMVTGLTNPPQNLVREIFGRTEGNPLFVTELIKTMLENNLLLDSSGRWASATFDAIEINFEKIQVPKTLSGLMHRRFETLPENEKKILKWMSVFGRSLSLELLKDLTGLEQPQSALLGLTREDLIERTDREHHYYFSNVMMSDVVYSGIEADERAQMHGKAAAIVKDDPAMKLEYLRHVGKTHDDAKAVEALMSLTEMLSAAEKHSEAMEVIEGAWERSQNLPEETREHLQTMLAETTAKGRDYKKAVIHYQLLSERFENATDEIGVGKRVEICEKLGDLYIKLNQYDRGLELFDKALQDIDRVPGGKVRRLLIENHRANAFMKNGKLDLAEEIFRKSRTVWETELSEAEKKKVTNNWLVDILVMRGRYKEALLQLQNDAAYFESIDNQYLRARCFFQEGECYHRQAIDAEGPEREAIRDLSIASFESSLKITREIDAYDLMMRAYNSLGNLYFHDHEYDLAAEIYQKSLAVARKADERIVIAIIANNLGNIFNIQKKWRDAHAYFVYGINTIESIERKNTFCWERLCGLHIEIVDPYLEMSEVNRAEEALAKAWTIVQEHPHLLAANEFWIYFQRMKLYFKQGHRALYQDSRLKAERLAKEGFEKEELKKVVGQHELAQGKSGDSISQALPEEAPHPTPVDPDVTLKELETVIDINQALNSEHDIEHLLKLVLNYALKITDAESGMVLIVDENGNLSVKAAINEVLSEKMTQFSVSVSKKCMELGDMIVAADAYVDSRFDQSQSVVLNELKSILCLPLKSRNKVVGVLYLDNRYKANAFKSVNSRLLKAYGDQVGIALENARLIEGYAQVQKQLEVKLHQTEDELSDMKDLLEVSVVFNRYSYDHIIGKSESLRDIFKVLDKITDTNLSVVLQGASGTGKELIARALHDNNPTRNQKHFVAINCSAIPAGLMESELFGHKAGSFTGAVRDKKGLFEMADGGTLFLDEVGDLDLGLQAKLLRALQEGEIQRVGDVKIIPVDVRIVCASHRDIAQMVKEGIFREDLYYRLCQIKLDIPGLAKRKEDIPLLARHFVESYEKTNKIEKPFEMTSSFLKALIRHDWPGNIRELQNSVQVACALADGSVLDASTLPVAVGGGVMNEPQPSSIHIDDKNAFDAGKTWADYEALIIAKCYKSNARDKAETHKMLGVSPSTLYKKIRELNLEDPHNHLFADTFEYVPGRTLKDYLPLVFGAALKHADDHPYAAIKQLNVSQGYFYKILKQIRGE